MKTNFVDCFVLMGTALSMRGGEKLPEMGRPLLQDVYTTVVKLSLSLQEFRIDSKSMEAEIATVLNQMWIDPRLGANAKTRKLAVAGQIWKPKIISSNTKTSLCNNDDTVFWRGYGDDGKILLSEKLNLKVACTQHFRKFPFDTQVCELKFGTYRFPKEEVAIIWDQSPIEITTDVNFNEFEIINVTKHLEIDIRLSGNFSVATVQIHLKRNSLHFIHCLILPCILLTFLNYVSLWLNINDRSTRIHMNFSVFAIMLYLYYVSVCQTHPTSYLKAIDMFIAVCKFFALVTLLESLFIDGMCRNEDTHFHSMRTACSKEFPRSVYWSELVIKVAYPVCFVFFLILFGIAFMD